MIKRPMLAGTAKDLGKIKFPVLASPKLDGFRCLKIDGEALSRSFKPIANKYTREYIEKNLPDNIDGELMIEGQTFNELSSSLRKYDGEPNFVFHAFDWIDSTKNFEARQEELSDIVKGCGENRLKLVEHIWLNSLDELTAYEEKCLAEGYEGVMVRDPEGGYKEGRSTEKQGWLLKVKRFKDSEAEVLGFEEQMHNTNEKITNELGLSSRATNQENMVATGLLGKFLVRDIHSGVEFKIGTGLGLTQKMRKDIWENQDKYRGELVKYKFQPEGTKDRPRLPVWLGFRAKEDMVKI